MQDELGVDDEEIPLHFDSPSFASWKHLCRLNAGQHQLNKLPSRTGDYSNSLQPINVDSHPEYFQPL
jgi:hypothetical protein